MKLYPAIYDFALLPYALGDVLTWNVKQCIAAREMRAEAIDIYLCTDPESPSNVHQFPYIRGDDFQLHLMELMPAFYANPMLRNIHLFQDRAEFGRVLSELDQGNSEVEAVLARYKANLDSRTSILGAGNVVIQEVSAHQEINKYFEKHKTIPKLGSPNGCLKDMLEFRAKIGEGCFVVLSHFRMRKRDAALGIPETTRRDADFEVWYEFIKFCERKFPDVVFVLLGKVQEKPAPLLKLNNVIFPRLLGYNLGHELALFQVSDMFLGTSSGFAAMANFSDLPYSIHRVMERACEFYGIKMGEKRLPFARPDQTLSHEEESVSTLLADLVNCYKPWKASAKRVNRSGTDEIRTSAYYQISSQIQRDAVELTRDKMRSARRLSDEKKFNEALQVLDETVREYPEIAWSIPLFQSARAVNLFFLKRYAEAREAIYLELTSNPYLPITDQIKHFLATIEMKMRQEGVQNE